MRRAPLTILKFSNVKTYMQSGAGVLGAPDDSTAGISKEIERIIPHDFGFSVPVFSRASKEPEKVVECNPVLMIPAIDHSKPHVTFPSDTPLKTAADPSPPLAKKPKPFYIIGRDIYLNRQNAEPNDFEYSCGHGAIKGNGSCKPYISKQLWISAVGWNKTMRNRRVYGCAFSKKVRMRNP